MARQPVVSVWNEIRITGDGISMTLYSEGSDGVRVEDEVWFTTDELDEMAAGMESLRLSDETKDKLEGDANLSLEELRESLKEESVRKRFKEGDRAIDANSADWSMDAEVEVIGYAEEQADEYVIEESLNTGDSKTVADANPQYDPDEPVVEAMYESGGDTYAFPESRLEPVSDEA
jgi:hypothetical protein